MSLLTPRPVVLQLPTPCVVAMVGASGAGKSTFARRLALLANTLAISYDQCREELTGDPHDQSATDAAVELAHGRVRERCLVGLSTIVDATHTTREDRRPLIDLAAAYDMPAVVVALATPLPDCLQRQLARTPANTARRVGEQVPEDAVRTQHAAVLASPPPPAHRGLALRARSQRPAPGPPGRRDRVMFQQETRVKAICDHCRTPAQARHDDGDVTLLFADEDQAREALGLDEPDGHWRQLNNSLLICGPCALIHDCVLAGGHHFTDWTPCSCEGWRDDHATNEAVRTGVCGHEVRICPQCHTTENRPSTTALTTLTTYYGGTR